MEKYEPVIEPLLTPREVAAMFRVEVRTVARWAREGKLASSWTAGGRGHRRYREADVRALLDPALMAAIAADKAGGDDTAQPYRKRSAGVDGSG